MAGYSAPAFGALTTGFVPKLTSDIVLDITTQARGNIDPNLDLSPTEPMGQAVQIVAGSIAEVWEVVQTTYNAVNPNAAEGVFLYGIGSISGTYPLPATFSTVVCTAAMSTSATVSAGVIANVNGQPTNTWQLLGACNAQGQLTSQTLTSTSAGNYNSLWQATVSGPVIAAAGQLTVIPSLPAGLLSITNPADATLGTVAETDAEFRNRRANELAAVGSESLDAIRAAVLEVTGVLSVQVYENTGDVTDGFGRPPHSIEVVVWDGTVPAASNNAIAQAMWNNKPGGIQFYSFTGDTGTATDSQGGTHAIVFTRVSAVPIYINVTTLGVSGSGATAAVQNSFVLTANGTGPSALYPGATVYRKQLEASPLPDGPNPVAGCVDVPVFQIGLVTGATGTSNLTFTARQYPWVQAGTIFVTLT